MRKQEMERITLGLRNDGWTEEKINDFFIYIRSGDEKYKPAVDKARHIYTHDELSEMVKAILLKYEAESALLFGSYARQEATPESDIDLIVIGGDKFEPTNIFAVAEELYRASGKNVDVYELNEIKKDSPLYKNIFAEGVKIA